MRLKEDSSSWKSNSIKHRDNRHISSDNPMIFKSPKNTKKWCKGRTGKLHDYKFMDVTWVLNTTRRIRVCTNCSKQDWPYYALPKTQAKDGS